MLRILTVIYTHTATQKQEVRGKNREHEANTEISVFLHFSRLECSTTHGKSQTGVERLGPIKK